MCYAIFVDILTLISSFSNLLARCYNALFACCDCILLLFLCFINALFLAIYSFKATAYCLCLV